MPTTYTTIQHFLSVSDAIYVIVISMPRDPKQQFLYWMEFLKLNINRDKCALIVVGSKMDLVDAKDNQHKIHEFHAVVTEQGLSPPILLSSLTLDKLSDLKKRISKEAKNILSPKLRLAVSYAICLKKIWASTRLIWKESPHSGIFQYFHNIGEIIYSPSSGVICNVLKCL